MVQEGLTIKLSRLRAVIKVQRQLLLEQSLRHSRPMPPLLTVKIIYLLRAVRVTLAVAGHINKVALGMGHLVKVITETRQEAIPATGQEAIPATTSSVLMRGTIMQSETIVRTEVAIIWAEIIISPITVAAVTILVLNPKQVQSQILIIPTEGIVETGVIAERITHHIKTRVILDHD